MDGRTVERTGSARRAVLAPLLALLVALAGALFLCAPAARAIDAGGRGLIEAVNDQRVTRGIAALRYEPRLARIAQGFARASANGASRGDPALDVSARLRDQAYAFLAMRAFAAVGPADPAAQARAWMAERERRNPLLDARFLEIGVGRVSLPGPVNGTADADQVWAIVLAAPTAPVATGWGARVLEHVNEFRRQNGLLPLSRNALLDRAAQAHAEDMAQRDYFAHRSPQGTGPADRVDRTGYHWSRVLENLAAGQPSAREVVEGWKNSKTGHREAMLDKTVREAGIGYRYRPRAGRVPVQHFWAMTLAAPR